jgi:DNA-binding GntR family transcriptional regulator
MLEADANAMLQLPFGNNAFGDPPAVLRKQEPPLAPRSVEGQGDGQALAHGALRHELAKRLLAEIFQGKMPAGSRLIILDLAERFRLSSTPVREALLELEANGVVQFVHNRGAIVKPFGPEQLREIFHLRRILEAEAARLACGRVDRGRLLELREQLRSLAGRPRGSKWLEREMLADRGLHAVICENCGNTRLMEDIRRYDTLVQALRDVVGNRRRIVNEAVKEHAAIVDAMLDGKPDAAARAMAIHVDRAARSAEAAMFGRK